MKKLALSLIAVAGLTGPALAADMAVKALPPVAPLMTWTGFYVGINGGGAAMNGPSMGYVDGAINAYVPVTVNPSSSTSGIAGFHLGYNYQMPNNWVLGVEGDWDWTNLKASAATGLLCSGPPCPRTMRWRQRAHRQRLLSNLGQLACQRPRPIGLLLCQWLLYGTGGVAFADVGYTGESELHRGRATRFASVAPRRCGAMPARRAWDLSSAPALNSNQLGIGSSVPSISTTTLKAMVRPGQAGRPWPPARPLPSLSALCRARIAVSLHTEGLTFIPGVCV